MTTWSSPGSSYPVRSMFGGAPDSKVVLGEGDYQSKADQWMSDWQGRWNAATPKPIGPSKWDMIQQGTQDAGGYFLTGDQGAKDPFTDGWQSDGNPWLNMYATGAFNKDGTDPSYLVKALGQDRFNQIANFEQATDVSERRALDAEKARQQAQFDREKNLRQENQTRQQQAYDTNLMGNNAIGGVMPGNYTDPNYGQVTGQPSSGIGGLGGLGGFDFGGAPDTTATAAYMGGSGGYAPNSNQASGPNRRDVWRGF